MLCLLLQQGYGRYIITLEETRFDDGFVLEIAEAQQLHGAEPLVVAQAELQAVVGVKTALVENNDFLISICGCAERADAISRFLILDIITYYPIDLMAERL
jgi:hypothetical protein